jgi:acetolactate synthase-1/2/3 large subunit
MEAQGYSRITGKPGVALVTTGGGTSNAVTGILSAHLDSIPVLLLNGNESSFQCQSMHDMRAYGVQGFDSVATIRPISKWSQRVENLGSLNLQLDTAWDAMSSGRPGPAHLDFPMDLQRKPWDGLIADGSLETDYAEVAATAADFEALSRAFKDADRPILIIGNGVRIAGAEADLKTLIEALGVPVVTSWSAIDLLPENHPRNLGRIGIYGDRHANIALQQADLVVSIGSRLAIPQVGYDVKDFGRNAAKWVIDIDQRELDKFKHLNWNLICADARFAIQSLSQSTHHGPNNDSRFGAWATKCMALKAELPRGEQVGMPVSDSANFVHSFEAVEVLNKELDDNAIIVTDVGAALLHGHYGLEIKGSQRLFSSQGLGEMGFGLPAAIGAYFGDPSKQLICLDTDGAMMFNLQEMQVASHHDIPIKLFVFNNDGYSMIKISQENLFGGRKYGSTPESGISIPNFEQVANLFGFGYTRVANIETMSSLLKPVLRSSRPELIEIVMEPGQRYLPRLSTSKLDDGTLVSPPLEDLEPLLDLDYLEGLLGAKAHPNSYKARMKQRNE